jgi:hypothetical protein
MTWLAAALGGSVLSTLGRHDPGAGAGGGSCSITLMEVVIAWSQ